MKNTYKNNLIEDITKSVIIHSENLFKSYHHLLLKDPYLNEQLKLLRDSIEQSRNTMRESGMSAECFKCSVNDEATCCGNEYSLYCNAILLLINRLLGVEIKQQTYSKTLCAYITPTGCSLLARPVICLNFLCNRLRANIPHHRIVITQNIVGKELDNLFRIEEYIKKLIK